MEIQVREYIESLIRTLLTPLVGWLAVNGYVSESQSVQLTAIIVSLLVSIVWSFTNKYWWKKKVETALELPQNSSLEKLNDVLANK